LKNNKKKKQPPKYILEISEEQAQCISIACEVLSRIGAGQFHVALEHLPFKKDIDWGEWHNDMDNIRARIRCHTIDNVDGYHKSLGIYNKDISQESKICWDIYQVVRRALAWDRAVKEGIIKSIDEPRKWPEMMAVSYDEPMNSAGIELAKIKKVEE